MGKFTGTIVIAQLSVTLAGILLVLGGRIEYAGEYLTAKDLSDMGLPLDEFRTQRTFPWGRMIYKVSADVRGLPVFIEVEVEAGAEPHNYDDRLKAERKRNRLNRKFKGYHDMEPLPMQMKGFIIKQRIQTDYYRVLTEIHFFYQGHLVMVRVLHSHVDEPDVEGALSLTQTRAMTIVRMVSSRCR